MPSPPRFWEVIPDQASLRVFAGTYSEYKLARQTETAAAIEGAAPRRKEEPRRQPQGLSKFEQRRRQQRIDAIEAEIAQLEAQMGKITRHLENPPADPFKVQQLAEEYNRLQEALEERMSVWMREVDSAS
jgi:ATP-binding cassette, subfamily F, member 3